jgi:hypothetical protein
MKKIMILSAVIGIIGSGTAVLAQNSGGVGSTVVGQDREAVREGQMNREPSVTIGSVRPFDTEQQVNRGMKQDRLLPERGAPVAEEAAPAAPR